MWGLLKVIFVLACLLVTGIKSCWPPSLLSPVSSSLTITGPGHDNVVQETIHQPDSNETVISVPAHGNNIAQQVVLQGSGGVNNVTSPLLAYVREGACYVTDLPEVFNPSGNTGGSGQTSVDSAESLNKYFIHDDFSLIVEGSNEYNQLSNSIKSKCSGKEIFKVNNEQLSEEAWQQKQEEESFNLSGPVEQTELRDFRMSLRRVDTEVSDRQSGCSISQWYGCTSNTWSGQNSSCWYWMLEEAGGNLNPVVHVHDIMYNCLSCTRFCPEDYPATAPLCDCDRINNLPDFLACYRSDRNWYQCPPEYHECPGPVCIHNSVPCP